MVRALVCLALALLAGCGSGSEPQRLPAALPATPAVADVAWRESYPAEGPGLRFEVERLRITERGWSAEVAIENASAVAWHVERDPGTGHFGLMLFADDDLEALEEEGRQGLLPPPRRARRFAPEPPQVLQRGARWRGTISAPGTLPRGAYVRVSFGPLVAAGRPPEGMEPTVVWITDHAHRLA